MNNRILRKILIAGIYIGLWAAASEIVGQSLLLPGPWETLRRFVRILAQPNSWLSAGMTLGRILAGYLIGVITGVVLAVICAGFSFADELLSPLRSIVKATPVTSIILLFLLWFHSGLVPVFISALMVLPVVWTNTLTSIRQTDPKLLEMGRAYGFSKKAFFADIYAPSVLPGFLAGCTTSLGFAWKSGVAAEILSQPQLSVGYALYKSKLTLETGDLFAWTLLVVLLSMLLEKLLLSAMGRIHHD